MSFMPAEEDDDFDLEDGFIDCDNFTNEIPHFPKDTNSKKNFETSKSRSASSNKYGSEPSGKKKPGIFSYGSEPSGKKNPGVFSSPSQRRSHLERSSSVVSTEDLRMGIMKNNTEIAEKYHSLGLPIDEPLPSGWTALMYAAHYVRPEHVSLMLKFGANANYQCDMFTPLMCACSATSGDAPGVEQCVKDLIQAGADVNARDRFHTTALMLASREGYLGAVKALVGAGTEVNMQDNQGWTALTMATQRSRALVIVELLDAGADPNIQHADKLTVKDLAAHLPTDDMLALLERRPVNTTSRPLRQTQGTAAPYGFSSENNNLNSSGSGARLTDLRYGELEVFLLGLDLGHLMGVFQEQLIDLQLLMTLTEQDLTNAGVDQVGARKKILDAVQAVHKKVWQPSSLVSIHYNKRISCADAVAMVANSSRHLRYICSTVVYVKEQLRKHPDTIMQPLDSVSPSQFLRHTEDTMKNLQELSMQVNRLKSDLEKRLLSHNPDPPDLIREANVNSRLPSFVKRHRLGSAVVVLACLAAVAWWGRDSWLELVADKIRAIQ